LRWLPVGVGTVHLFLVGLASDPKYIQRTIVISMPTVKVQRPLFSCLLVRIIASPVLTFNPKVISVAILDAGRNALSFFMLLVVSLGLSVVRESLGRTMLRCQLLAGAHFLFGGIRGLSDFLAI
jgi:hypothetical protein